MTRDVAHIAARAFNTPLLIHPRKAEIIASVLAGRLDGVAPLLGASDMPVARDDARGRSQMLNRFDGENRGPKIVNAWGDEVTQTRYLYRNGLALVSVEGTLVNRGAWIGADSGMTSYEGVRAQLASAAADPEVATIILDIDSPGGEATGAFEMADFVRQIAAQTPVVAMVDGMAASAAYAMASGASKIVAIPTGLVGSIGVVLLHLDRSKQLDKQGVAPTLIFAGAHKVDGHPFAALPDDVRAQFQSEIDALYGAFVAQVAKGRPMSTDQIRATEARVFSGSEAVSLGLADAIGTLDDLVASLDTRRTSGFTRGATMSQNSQTAAAAAAADVIAKADHEAAISAAGAEAAKTAAVAERARVAAILDAPDAKGRETLARHYAFSTDDAPDKALAALKAAPVAAAPARSRLDAAAPDVQVGADSPAAQTDSPEAIGASWDSSFAAVKAKASAR